MCYFLNIKETVLAFIRKNIYIYIYIREKILMNCSFFSIFLKKRSNFEILNEKCDTILVLHLSTKKSTVHFQLLSLAEFIHGSSYILHNHTYTKLFSYLASLFSKNLDETDIDLFEKIP